MNDTATHTPSKRRAADSTAAFRLLDEASCEPPASLGDAAWPGRVVSRGRLSIIIPIYNGSALLTRCLEALAKETPPHAEVILVDDHSTDTDIETLCRDFCAQWTRALYIRNKQNLGYVSSVNIGIRASNPQNDVVLLNSDTEVTPFWVRRLMVAVASRPNIASVSPLSNAAGVFSLPEAYRDAPLEPGWTPAMAQGVLSRVARRHWEEVPVSCGFCMYLSRDAIVQTGIFDERLFLRGYGEENDWCERARNAGFIHVVDESCFVAHTHGASFGAEKHRLKQRNSRILKAMFPAHVDDTKVWLAKSRLEEVRKAFGSIVDDTKVVTPEFVEALTATYEVALVGQLGGSRRQPGAPVVECQHLQDGTYLFQRGGVEFRWRGVAEQQALVGLVACLDIERFVVEGGTWDTTFVDVLNEWLENTRGRRAGARATEAVVKAPPAAVSPLPMSELLVNPIVVGNLQHLLQAPGGGALHLSEGSLVCPEQGLEFPIVDGSPALIRSEGRPWSGLLSKGFAQQLHDDRRWVLDVGTKDGKGLRSFLAHYAKLCGIKPKHAVSAVGVDYKPTRLAAGQGFGVFTVRADARELPFKDRSFDVVVLMEILEHIPVEDALKFLKEARRVAKDKVFLLNPDFTSEAYLRERDLKFSWMDWRVHPHHVTFESLKELLQEAGFTRFDLQQVMPVQSSSHPLIVPLSAARDTEEFDPAIHKKDIVKFTQPVWEKLQVVASVS